MALRVGKKPVKARNEKGEFLPGVPTNPGGRPKLDPLVRAYRSRATTEFYQLIQHYGDAAYEAAARRIADPTTPLMIRIHLRLLMDAEKGDHKARELLYDRILGKVPDEMILETVNQVRDELRAMSTSELLAIMAKSAENKPE